MRIECPTREGLGRVLREAGDSSLDFVFRHLDRLEAIVLKHVPQQYFRQDG